MTTAAPAPGAAPVQAAVQPPAPPPTAAPTPAPTTAAALNIREEVNVVYGTGGGATTPAGLDGQIAPAILAPINATPVTAQVGGVAANVTYSGAAPGLVSGALQVNVEIPANAPSGPRVPVVIIVAGVPTQAGITVAIE